MSDLKKVQVKQLKEKLTEMAIFEEGMSVEDMKNTLAAVENSYISANNENHIREYNNAETVGESGMKRKYVHVLERRMPWCLFPVPKQLTLQQRINILSTYKDQQNVSRYRKAKTSAVFAEWEVKSCIRISNKELPAETKSSTQYSRRGRLLNTCPQYAEVLSDSETSPSKKKAKKKTKKLTNEEIMAKSSLFQDTIHDIKNGNGMSRLNNICNIKENLNNSDINFNASGKKIVLNNSTNKKRDANDELNVVNIPSRDKKRIKVSEER